MSTRARVLQARVRWIPGGAFQGPEVGYRTPGWSRGFSDVFAVLRTRGCTCDDDSRNPQFIGTSGCSWATGGSTEYFTWPVLSAGENTKRSGRSRGSGNPSYPLPETALRRRYSLNHLCRTPLTAVVCLLLALYLFFKPRTTPPDLLLLLLLSDNSIPPAPIPCSLLRLGSDAWSVVRRPRQGTNEYVPLPPPLSAARPPPPTPPQKKVSGLRMQNLFKKETD